MKKKQKKWDIKNIKQYFGDEFDFDKILEEVENIEEDFSESAKSLKRSMECINTKNKYCLFKLYNYEDDKSYCGIRQDTICTRRSSKHCPIYKNKEKYYLASHTYDENHDNIRLLTIFSDEPLVSSMLKATKRMIETKICPNDVAILYVNLYQILWEIIYKKINECGKDIYKEEKTKLREALKEKKKGNYPKSLKILLEVNKNLCKNYNKVYVDIIELKILTGLHPTIDELKEILRISNRPIFMKYVKEQILKHSNKHAIKYFQIFPIKKKNTKMLRQFAECYEKIHEYTRAISIYKKIKSFDTSFRIIECYIKDGKYSESWSILSEILLKATNETKRNNALAISKKLLELNRLNQIQKQELNKICQQILMEHPRKRYPREILNIIKNEQKRRITGEKQKARELLSGKKWKSARQILIKIYEKEKNDWVIIRIAQTYGKEKKYSQSLVWYNKLSKPLSKINLIRMLTYYLYTNDYKYAKELAQELKKTSLSIDMVNNLTTKGFYYEQIGKFAEALNSYYKKKDILHLIEELHKYNEPLLIIKCYLKLSKISATKKYAKITEELLEKYEQNLTILQRNLLRRSLEKEFNTTFNDNELVICDSNIFVYAALHNTRIFHKLDSDNQKMIKAIVKKFNNLSSGHSIGITESIKVEIKPVCQKILRHLKIIEINDEYEVIKRIEKYIDKYNIDYSLKGDELCKVIEFYEQHHQKILKITERKIQNKSQQEKEKILLKRSRGLLPEKKDMEILAECISLNQTKIKNITKISLLSNDADFTEFKDDINNKFHIKVY